MVLEHIDTGPKTRISWIKNEPVSIENSFQILFQDCEGRPSPGLISRGGLGQVVDRNEAVEVLDETAEVAAGQAFDDLGAILEQVRVTTFTCEGQL